MLHRSPDIVMQLLHYYEVSVWYEASDSEVTEVITDNPYNMEMYMGDCMAELVLHFELDPDKVGSLDQHI